MNLVSFKFNVQFLKLKFFNKKNLTIVSSYLSTATISGTGGMRRSPSFNTDRNGSRPDHGRSHRKGFKAKFKIFLSRSGRTGVFNISDDYVVSRTLKRSSRNGQSGNSPEFLLIKLRFLYHNTVCSNLSFTEKVEIIHPNREE